MSETVKINLDKALTSIKIMSAVAGAIIAIFVVYINIDSRIDRIENEQAVYRGVQDERTRQQGDDINELKSDMKLLLNKLELTRGQEESQENKTSEGATFADNQSICQAAS